MAILVDLGDSPARDRAGSMQMCKGFTISIAEGADLRLAPPGLTGAGGEGVVDKFKGMETKGRRDIVREF